MITRRNLLPAIILLLAAACQPTLVTQEPLPTLMVLPTLAPTAPPTQTPRPIPTVNFTASPTAIFTSTPITVTPTFTPSRTLLPPTLAPPTVTLTLTPRKELPEAFVYGHSVEGRDLYARRFGTGPQVIMLVGGIHTGFETNTVTLINELIAHFERSPQDVLPDVMLVLIPAANPDGLQHGIVAGGRVNANGVDLNRNWDCDWSADAVWQDRTVDPGPQPFSEPESQALASLILDMQPAVVLFYHAAARGVFAGDCNGRSVSQAMAEVLGEATGYPYDAPFTDYSVTGTESNWVDGQGIPSADVELTTSNNTDFVRNLNGVMALQHWLVDN
jgi:hypothetical protein